MKRIPSALCKYSAVVTIFAAAVTMVAAQSAAPATMAGRTNASASETPEETVILSPFVVDAGEDSDTFRATSTLAGTRIRTDLKDVGSAISVITSKFLQDTGARNNQELLKYTTNTEVGGVGGTFSGAGAGTTLTEPGLLRPNGNTRVRGLAAADNTRDFFLTEIPWDSYNIGRVDIQRGPSSILFGMGSPAGIINNSTNTASFGNSGKIEARFDNEGSVRGSLDVNTVLREDELAVRFSALDDNTKYRQKPAYNRDERLYGALKFEPAFLRKNGMVTSLRANIESGKIRGNRPRSLSPYDNILPWFTDENRATYDPFLASTAFDGIPSGIQRGTINGVYNPYYRPWVGGYGVGNGATAVFADPNSSTQTWMRNWKTGDTYFGIGPGNAVDSSNLNRAIANDYFGIGAPGAVDFGIDGPGGDYSEPQGITSYANWARNVFTPANTDPLWNGVADPLHRGLPYASLGAYKDRNISNPGVFDFYNKLLDGPNKWERQGFDAFNVALSQSFFDNRFGFEAVYDSQRYRESRVNGVKNALYIDNNFALPGVAPANAGSNPPNAYVGRAYVVSDNYGSQRSSKVAAKRLTGFYELRGDDFSDRGGWFAKVFGRHTFTGLVAEEEQNATNLTFQRYVMPQSFADSLFGKGTKDAHQLQNLYVPIMSYVSGDLRGVSDPSSINLSNVTALQTPSTLVVGGTKGVFAFDSHWARPIDPNAPGYVNPSAFFNNTRIVDGSRNTQSENVDNYYLFHQVPTGDVVSFEDGAPLYNDGQKTWRNVKSTALIWQGHLFDGLLVPTFGWRKDDFKGGGENATYSIDNADPTKDRTAKDPVTNQVTVNDPTWFVDHDRMLVGGAWQPRPLVSGQSRSWSLVLHTPRSISDKMPWRTNVSLFYNRSDNFQPRPGDVDMFAQPLANPTGKTKDYGFVVSTLDDRVSLKINWYNTNVTNDRLSGFRFGDVGGLFGSLMQSAYRVKYKDLANTWKWNYDDSFGPPAQVLAEAGANALFDAYGSNPVFKNFVDGWGMAKNLTQPETSSSTTPVGINATTDSISKGIEFELSAEPVKGWNIAVNASKTKATQTNIGGALADWIAVMDPIMNGPVGDLRQWWAGDPNNFRSLWASQIMSQFNLLNALEGTNVPELRPWRFNAVTSYTFGSSMFNGKINGLTVGGAYRWEDKVVNGFHVIKRAKLNGTGDELVYDVSNPFYGPAEDHLDLWAGYTVRRLFSDKIDWRIQLNIRDVFASKDLIPITVQPDGGAAAYRIPALTTWSITNTFSF